MVPFHHTGRCEKVKPFQPFIVVLPATLCEAVHPKKETGLRLRLATMSMLCETFLTSHRIFDDQRLIECDRSIVSRASSHRDLTHIDR
jgi:hypothetical protein